jgi:hypothetical protein
MNFIFHNIWDVILPIDSYFSRWLKPPTRMGFIELAVNFDVMSMFGIVWNLDTRFYLDFGGIL